MTNKPSLKGVLISDPAKEILRGWKQDYMLASYSAAILKMAEVIRDLRSGDQDKIRRIERVMAASERARCENGGG